ncbi:hypothetical protein BCS58_08000 [Enterovibrio norvegicus]|uniref:hypothetical protein n=1 Tax=Enterovibrio norvegicus TaxID=188144 RepID=UPI00389ADD03
MAEIIVFKDLGRFYDKDDIEEVISEKKTSNYVGFCSRSVEIQIEGNCKFLADAQLKLLCLFHHLVNQDLKVSLVFLSGKCRCFTFMDRCGFFANLPNQVSVTPEKPKANQAASLRFQGQSVNLHEIRAVDPIISSNNRPIPSHMTDALSALLKTNCERFLNDIQTVICEFCDNVSQHSQSTSPGFVYMHHYPFTQSIYIVIADVGVGLLNSLRQGLRDRNNIFKDSSDETLLLEMFNNGLSRKEEQRGSGLNRMADIAIKYQGTLHLRLDKWLVDLTPTGGKFASARFRKGAEMSGTHISFSFEVPNL